MIPGEHLNLLENPLASLRDTRQEKTLREQEFKEHTAQQGHTNLYLVLGPAAMTSLEHLSANSLKLLWNRPAKFTAVLSNSASVLPAFIHASFGQRTSLGTSLMPSFGCIKPNTGISSHSTDANEPSWIASMSCLVYFRLQRLPTPYGPPTHPVLIRYAEAPTFSSLAASISA